MYKHSVFRNLVKVAVPAVTVVYAKKEDSKCDKTVTLVRASELPLYADDKSLCTKCLTKPEEKKTILTESIKCVREELWFLMDQARIVKYQAINKLGSAVEQTGDALEFLREESNLMPRVGAIAVGGLAGFVMAIRKGIIKKMLYTSAGLGVMSALCYPKEAQECSKEGLLMTKKYIVLSYHFLNGVSRDLLGVQLPALPGTHHFIVSDDVPADPDAVPSSAHLLPPTVTATHIHAQTDETRN